MRRFPVHIKNIDGTQTACTTFQLWSGLTTNIAEAHICPPYSAITRTDLTNPTGYTADIYYNEPTLIDEIYVFLVHCDGFILPSSGVPCCGDTQPKKQGGYQIRAVKLFCPTPTPTPTTSRAVICTFEGGVATIVTGTLPGPTPTATPPTPTQTTTPPTPTQTSSGPIPTPTHTPPPPTPTSTVAIGCINISESTNTTQDVRCPDNYSGQYYNRTTNTVTVQLLSGYGGSPVVATQNIQVLINIDYYAVYVPGGGGYSPYVETVTIPQGQSQTTFQYDSETTVQNPYELTCQQETKSIAGIASITPNTIIACVPDTPPPTPTASVPLGGAGQCYTYTLDYGVSDTAYGVSYEMVGVGLQILQFNSLPSNVGPGNSQVYNICSTVEPTLLDTSSWPSTMGIGSGDGISRTGPNGSCSNNFDCQAN